MNQPLAQALGLPGLEGPPWSSSSPAPSWWGKDSRSRRDVSIDSCDPASFDSMFWAQRLSYLPKQPACWTNPPCLLWWESTQGWMWQGEVATNWASPAEMCRDLRPSPSLWGWTRNGKQGTVSWADPLLEYSCWSSKCEDDLMIGQSGGWWLSKGWRQEESQI